MTNTSIQNEPSPRQRVLVLAHRLPYPPDRGDRIRSYHILRTLCDKFDLAIACTSDESVWLQQHQLLSTMARRVAIMPISSRWSTLRSIWAMLCGNCATSAFYYRTGLAQQILQWHEQDPVDAILTYCTGMISYARTLTHRHMINANTITKRPRHIIDLVDVDSLKWQSFSRHSWAPMRWAYATEARRLQRIEAGTYDAFDGIAVTTQAEANAYQNHIDSTKQVTVIKNGVDLEYFRPTPDPDNNTIAFVGVLNYWPNTEGVCWFVRCVMPLLRQLQPKTRFLIVGRHPTQKIRDLDREQGISVIGSVPDIREYLSQASVVIAPLLIARGIQNKILEAMACAKAVVCSVGAAEGVDVIDGEHLIVAQTPQQWAKSIGQLFEDRALRARLGQSARQQVEKRYNWSQCLEPMVQLIKGRQGNTAA